MPCISKLFPLNYHLYYNMLTYSILTQKLCIIKINSQMLLFQIILKLSSFLLIDGHLFTLFLFSLEL